MIKLIIFILSIFAIFLVVYNVIREHNNKKQILKQVNDKLKRHQNDSSGYAFSDKDYK